MKIPSLFALCRLSHVTSHIIPTKKPIIHDTKQHNGGHNTKVNSKQNGKRGEQQSSHYFIFSEEEYCPFPTKQNKTRHPHHHAKSQSY